MMHSAHFIYSYMGVVSVANPPPPQYYITKGNQRPLMEYMVKVHSERKPDANKMLGVSLNNVYY